MSKDLPQPGEFYEKAEQSTQPTCIEPQYETEPAVDQSFVDAFKLFQERFHPQVAVIYYPCSSVDMSPTVAFQTSQQQPPSVIYADRDEQAMKVLQENEQHALPVDVLDFNPGRVDLLLLFNPMI